MRNCIDELKQIFSLQNLQGFFKIPKLNNVSYWGKQNRSTQRSSIFSQFHQHFTSSFFVQKCYEHLFSSYSFCLNFCGKRILAEKLLVKCWWNWHLEKGHIFLLNAIKYRPKFSTFLIVSRSNTVNSISKKFQCVDLSLSLF